MRISAKTEYACIAMLELASQYKSGEPVRIRKIAERHGVPPRFLLSFAWLMSPVGAAVALRASAY